MKTRSKRVARKYGRSLMALALEQQEQRQQMSRTVPIWLAPAFDDEHSDYDLCGAYRRASHHQEGGVYDRQ